MGASGARAGAEVAKVSRTIKLKYQADGNQLALLRKCATICGKASIADFFGFAVTEYCYLLLGSLEVGAARAEASRAEQEKADKQARDDILEPSVVPAVAEETVRQVASDAVVSEVGGKNDEPTIG